MKRAFSLIVALGCLMSTGCAYQWVDSGNVGVRVNASGKNKGIDPKFIGVGRAWYNPMFEQIHEFPVFEQNALWGKESKDSKGVPVDESIMISSSKGAQINVDVGCIFEIEDEKAPVLFDKLRRDIDFITHQWLRNHVREALAREAEKLETMAILGEGKSQLLDKAKNDLNEQMKEYGIRIHMLSFASAPRPEAKIQASIDATITAQQLAIQAQNKIVQSKAEADQEIEKARGKAQGMIVEAEAELKRTELQAKGNKVLSESVTPALTHYMMTQKWNGTLPKFTGNSIPLINLNEEDKK